MVRDVTDDKVKSVMFSMEDDRATGLDGFTVAFFKKAWDVVGGDITCAIRDFFSNGKLLKELNHTIISLIPKVTTPAHINDYRPISSCNVLYKCISKIIANRVKEGLGEIVSINQSAFVPGHRISDNILLTQELMRNYHKRRGPPRCAFKVDIQKAYDTVDWNFLETILVGFGFHPKMVKWIMVCVSGSSYSISVNGNLHGWFKGKRELRVQTYDEFQYHHLCEQQRIINLCFADDLFLFARGHPNSVSVIMDALEEFKQASGLVPIITKSTTFFCNVPNAIKASILNSMPFVEGVLPVRYLGVPLISSRLLYYDCIILVETLESRVNDWRNKFVSLAGRLQLIQSVLSSMHIYWASVFILPTRIHEGGLGIRRIDDFNVALMATRIWSSLTHRESLWFNGFIRISLKAVVSGMFLVEINNGKSTSVWFDRWADVCPLKEMFSNRDIARPGFSLDNLVNNLIFDDVWRWLLDWLSRDGGLRPFLVACVWDTIQTRADMVNGYNVVWFPHCIPRHAIHMWLVVQQKLKTQDRLRYGLRNERLFKKKSSSSDQIVQVILSMVWLKLVTFKFKKMSIRSRFPA
ncbi:putative RNA-directed DNA polymerase [Tanacetum coccineum]